MVFLTKAFLAALVAGGTAGASYGTYYAVTADSSDMNETIQSLKQLLDKHGITKLAEELKGLQDKPEELMKKYQEWHQKNGENFMNDIGKSYLEVYQKMSDEDLRYMKEKFEDMRIEMRNNIPQLSDIDASKTFEEWRSAFDDWSKKQEEVLKKHYPDYQGDFQMDLGSSRFDPFYRFTHSLPSVIPTMGSLDSHQPNHLRGTTHTINSTDQERSQKGDLGYYGPYSSSPYYGYPSYTRRGNYMSY
ncbi:hypothetical protein MHLP_02205 [Candidatus Mycoplasma haematolamae str. Purdue]|uniref:DUF148 domain-containing protein n=1 Tax=Mycoplasma haematolamae (strain Purdue) TaxID=1212765 RepID=I7CFN3_MYCHA|nr:hypothetical protein [Candidatus Mycoplasma haematolamae]AFO52021.1 hypothetical protein MHLP_02205 [Candidatus Mycoplasma haematolamae str. Purdue]